MAGSPASRQRDARSGFRVLVVARAVAVVVESRDFFRTEARGVPPDGVGALLVTVRGVPDQVSLGHVEALRFALAGLDQRRDRGVDGVVGVLGPSGHAHRLLRTYAPVDRESESAQSNDVCWIRPAAGVVANATRCAERLEEPTIARGNQALVNRCRRPRCLGVVSPRW